MSRKRTREEIEKLKEDWEKEPFWDIEDTEDGFEEYREELKAFSDEKRAERDRLYAEKQAKRKEFWSNSCTVDGIMDDLHDLSMADLSSWDGDYDLQKAADAQVRAAVLQIKALMRIGDQLERIANKPVSFTPYAK